MKLKCLQLPVIISKECRLFKKKINLEFVLGKTKLQVCRKQFGVVGSKVLAWLSQKSSVANWG